MDLFSLVLKGYRRFRSGTMLRTNGAVVALVGPNEAGKTSILEALASLNAEQPLAQSDVARGTDGKETEIVAKFLLTDQEAADAGLAAPRWMRVHKAQGGGFRFGFDPPAPTRDPTPRSAAVAAARALIGDATWIEVCEGEDSDLPDLLRAAVETLEGSGPDLTRKAIDELTRIRSHFASSDATILDRHPLLAELVNSWSIMLDAEDKPNPFQLAVRALRPRIPKFLLFDEAARRLASSYAMADLRSEVPIALRALLEVAELDLAEVLSALTRGARDELTTLEKRANRRLETAFREAWRQSGVSVALRLSIDLLEIQILDQDERYTRLAERSDGLRQFVALHAFVARSHEDAPVLLIDEAEQRLHYDAQADLVQMLSRQRLASKVIYTTHSAGCLPEDLGRGVRLVEPVQEDASASRVVNKFWGAPGGGFSPLLFGLGASTLAFFPTRRAVCVEGPADMLLLPTMLREVLDVRTLGYQFVPGLASTARTLAPIMPAEAANVAFLVDGDAAGASIRAALVEGGIPDGRVVRLVSADGHAVELEDFVEPRALIGAVNALMARYHPDAPPLRPRDLRRKHRTKRLRERYAEATGREIDKVELAYELLDAVDADPSLVLCDPARKEELATIGRCVAGALSAR